jgi:hypothetical protein
MIAKKHQGLFHLTAHTRVGRNMSASVFRNFPALVQSG